jgi:nucleotide-binding universal stress UspA family protein
MRLAAKLAPSLSAGIVLLHVTELPPGLTETMKIRPMPDLEPIEAGRFVREASLAELERYAKELRALGVSVETRVELGDAIDIILRAARELAPAMIVMGTHGRTGLAHLLIGSVAEKIMRLSHRPVLTVPAAPAEEPRARIAN